MKKISLATKKAIVEQALNNREKSIAEIASTHNVGYSTLQKWLRLTREGQPLNAKDRATLNKKLSQSERLNHLLSTAHLDEMALGEYCRKEGIYSHQLTSWKTEFMKDSENTKHQKMIAELKAIKLENKTLKQDLRRKEKALAETAALLVLKKKAHSIWGEPEGD